jgi:putative transposase
VIQGTQYGSWAFTRRAQDVGLLPSMGGVGTCFDNAVMESFRSRVQVELLDRQPGPRAWSWPPVLFGYLEIFHNRQRRHSSLGMLTPFEFESRQGAAATSTVA